MNDAQERALRGFVEHVSAAGFSHRAGAAGGGAVVGVLPVE